MSKIEEDMKKATTSGFIYSNNFELLESEDGVSAIVKAKMTDSSLNPYGIAHGGFVFGLGDTSMGVVARSTGRKAVTLSANITYLKPSKGNYLIAKAEMVKNGKTTCYLRSNIYDENDILVASMDSNYYYID